MGRDALIQVALYIVFCSAATTELLLSPSQLNCIFIAYANVTCHWTPGKDSPPDTVYTFESRYCHPSNPARTEDDFSCTKVAQTHCSGEMNSPYRLYTFTVVTYSSRGTTSPLTLSINALDAVKLRMPVLTDLRPVKDKPGCLELLWHKPKNFALYNEMICSGSLNYELQYSTADQPEVQTVSGHLGQPLQKCSVSFTQPLRLEALCSLSPFTQYAVRLRQRYNRSIWSDWSHQLLGCTGITVPTTAPQLWRTIQPTDTIHQRQVTLLWKHPLKSQTACTSLWFNVSCFSEGSNNVLNAGKWLNVTDTSCQLTLPMKRSSCFLTMANSIGSSPPAWVTLPAPTDTALGNVEKVSLTVLNDTRLEVTWSTHQHPSNTGFLVEWMPALETDDPNDIQWERLSRDARSINISDLLPEVCYNVKVIPEFGNESGEARTIQAYTKQGVPSSGPRVRVKEQSSSAVLLVWEPVPLKEQHGFITQYTVYCHNTTHEERTPVPHNKLHCRLTGLSGVHEIYVTAHTVAGEGQAGPAVLVTIEDDYSEGTIIFCAIPIMFTLLSLLTIIICFRQRITQNICPTVPDPALSSLPTWMSNIKEHHFRRLEYGDS